MVSVKYCCRTAEGARRETVQLPPSCLSQQVSAARVAAARLLGLSADDIELVYRGRTLADPRPLASYDLTQSSVLHAFRRPTCETAAAQSVPEPDGTELSRVVQAAHMSQAHRTVFQPLTRPEVLEKLLAEVPSLADDPAAQAILQDPGLLVRLTAPNIVQKLVSRHPSLAAAAPQVGTILAERQSSVDRAAAAAAAGAGPSRAQPAAQAMDVAYDDEDGEGEEEPAAGAGGSAPPPITRAQLASALAAAQGAAGLPRAAPTAAAPAPAAPAPATPAPAAPAAAPPAPTRQPAAGAAGNVISQEMVSAALREAMLRLPAAAGQVRTGAPAPAPTQAPAPTPAAASTPAMAASPAGQQPVADDAAVSQLLELGITDDAALVRQALQVSDGNIDQAVEYIYSSMQGQ